jgi:hypothetical protein
MRFEIKNANNETKDRIKEGSELSQGFDNESYQEVIK